MSYKGNRGLDRIRSREWKIVRENELLRLRLNSSVNRVLLGLGVIEATGMFIARLVRKNCKSRK